MRPSVQRAYADGRFGQLHYRRAEPEAPTRRPLLCFHSSPNSGRLYETFLPHIGEDRIAIAVDTPGFGYSDPPPIEPSIEDYAAAMADLIDALALPEVDLAGYHTGSEIAVALALLRPDQVRRAIMISAPIFTDAELDDFRNHYAAKPLSPEGDHLVATWKGHLYWAGPGWTMQHVAEQFADVVRRPDISWWGHNAAFDFRTAEALAKVKQPVLVLNPDDDLKEQSLRAVPILGKERVRRLKDWGHGFLDIHSEAAAAIFREFLDADDA